MKANNNNININKSLIKQINFTPEQGEAIMKSTIKYDNFMEDMVNRIKSYDIDTLTQILMTMIKIGEIEQIRGNLYKYKDFHILELLKRDGIDYSNKLKTLDKLNLNITQKHLETVTKDNRVYIITQISGTETSNLTPLWKYGNQNVSKEDKLAAFQDLQKLTKAGLVDDNVLRSNEMWYVNSENKIIIPVFENLRPITSQDNPTEIQEKYYNILFR